MEVPMKRLVRKLDNDGNSILHTIRRKIKDFVSDEKMKGPAFLSPEELLCVEKFTPSHFLNHESTKKLTAEGFFVAANCELLDLARERLKITAEGCSGSSHCHRCLCCSLHSSRRFKSEYWCSCPQQTIIRMVFTVTDVLCLTFSLTSVVTFFSILSSPFRFKDSKHTLPDKLMIGFTFLFLSVTMLMVAYGATIILTTYNKESYNIH